MEDIMALEGANTNYRNQDSRKSNLNLWEVMHRGILNPLSNENKLFHQIIKVELMKKAQFTEFQKANHAKMFL